MNWKFWQRRDDTIGPDPTEAHPLDKSFDAPSGRRSLLADHKMFKGFFGISGLYLAGAIGVGIWWSQEPDSFDVVRSVEAIASGRGESLVAGYLTTATTINVARTLLEKPGGYLTNDLFPPGIWLDNIPSWEMGALTLLRDTAGISQRFFALPKSICRGPEPC